MAWSIATAARGSAPDFTLRREPSNSYTTRAQQWFLEQILTLESGSEDVDGGGYAHKPGYHDTVAHNDARSGKGKDYSASAPQDRRGPHDKTRARDWTFRDAQAGRYADFAKYGDRVMAAYRARDPRLSGWREYLGRVSHPVTVNGTSTRRVGIDFRYRYLRIPSASHDWHAHLSEDTEQVESFANKWSLLTVLAGWTLAQWHMSLEDEMAAVDVWKIKYREYVDEGGDGVRDPRTTADILYSTHAATMRVDRAAQEHTALLKRIAGQPADQILAEIRAEGEKTRAALLAAVREQAPTLAAAVVERLGTDVTASEIGEALAVELAGMLTGEGGA